MQQEALEYLVSLGAIPRPATLPENLTPVPVNWKLEDIEKHLDMPTRHRLAIATHDIEGFIAVSNESPAPDKACYVDDDKLGAVTFFNLGTPEKPGHADHKIALTLRATAEYKELCRIDGHAMDQRAMAEWLEDWREFITPVWPEGVQAEGMTKAISVIRNLTIDAKKQTEHTVADFGAEKSDLEKIEARGRDLPPPSRFIFNCNPYQGLDDRAIELRLSVITSGNGPSYKLRIVRADQLKQDLAEEFAEHLRNQLLDVAVVIGTVNR